MLIANQQLEVADHRELLPNTIFPVQGPSVQAIIDLGFYPVTVWLAHDRSTQKLVPSQPYLIDGVCYTVQVEDMTESDIQAEKDSAMANIRAQRNQLLSSTDWRFRSDLTPSQEWKDYCQALRDLPASIVASGADPRTWNSWPKSPDAPINLGNEAVTLSGLN